MKFYLDLNTKNGEILIGEIQNTDPAYYIVFEQRYLADNFLRKLNASLAQSPLLKLSLYEVLRIEENNLGKVYYYKLK